ncbi:MAG: hypothetical protein ACREFM_04795, partial [Hypericibacter sp.]
MTMVFGQAAGTWKACERLVRVRVGFSPPPQPFAKRDSRMKRTTKSKRKAAAPVDLDVLID